MKIIYNKYFPFGSFLATNICGIIFCRSDKGRLNEVDKNHEYIHTLQQREMLYIGFMLWYNIEWLINLLRYRNVMKAYYNINFEREAYMMERNLAYREQRRPFAWWYLFARKGTLLHETGCFIADIAAFIRQDFRLLKYLYVIAVAVTVIVAQVHYNIYDWLIAPSYDNGTSMLRLPIVYVTVYYLVLIPTLLFHHETWRLRQWQVWVLPALLVAIDGVGQGFDYYRQWIAEKPLSAVSASYLQLVGSFLFRSVFILTAIFLFHFAATRRMGLYGLTRSPRYLRIYFIIYASLLPAFLVVAFTPQFLDFYPKMHITFYEGAMSWSRAHLISLFELCYANDFFAVESMFRGALVIGLARWLGPRTVLPMAVTYMCVHLGKPDLELCSSVIGGYALGILAYQTHHLWGGILIHLGIAMFFEFVGLLRLLV